MLPDLLAHRLTVVFVGTSVSTTSAAREHYYSHHSNRFWRLLDATGLTGGAGLTSERDREITGHGCGLTDLVKGRAASSDALLDDSDYDVPGLLDRLVGCSPLIVAFNGKEAAKRVAQQLEHPIPAAGPIPWTVAGAAAYRLPSSSSASRMLYEQKVAAWRAFGDWARDQVSRAR